MERAILIAGDEKRFVTSIQKLSEYLINEAYINDVTILDVGVSPRQLRDRLMAELQKNREQATLLVYNGHGYNGGWSYSYGKRFPYDLLGPLLKEHRAPIFFINDCCHAYSAVGELEKHSWQFQFGLLAGSPADETSYDFTDEIVDSWRTFKPYDPLEHPYYVISLSSFGNWKVNIEGGLRSVVRNKLSRILNWLAPGYFKVYPLNVRHIFPEFKSTPEEAEAEETPHFNERPRWGDSLDHLFFPRQPKLDFYE